MKTGLGGVCAAALLATGVPAIAQVPPQPTITSDLVSRLCPVTGLPGLKLGASRNEQPPELLRSLRRLPDSFRPFTEAEVNVTSWSGRVAAITYRAASPDGDVNAAMLAAFDDSTRADGWQPIELGRTITPLSVLDGRALEREVDGPTGQQKLLLEFDASGALALRCGGLLLLEQDQRERDGTLEPRAPRPVAPAFDPALRLPAASACQSPTMQRLTMERAEFDEEAPELVSFLAAAMQESDRALSGKRLNVWLEWKMLGSGKVDDSRLTALRTAAAKQDMDAEMRQMVAILAIGGELAAARESGNPVKSCEATRKMAVFAHDKHRQESAYWDRVNTALEAEAERLGIVLD